VTVAFARPTAAQSTGGDAEQRAAGFLEAQGLRIVARNYRTRMGEIDLIAQEGATLVFVEVRMRSSARFGGALGSVDARKRARIVAAARHYLMRLGREPRCRFDVVTVEGPQPTWLRGAFEAS
jgi:putative endonuclease